MTQEHKTAGNTDGKKMSFSLLKKNARAMYCWKNAQTGYLINFSQFGLEVELRIQREELTPDETQDNGCRRGGQKEQSQ